MQLASISWAAEGAEFGPSHDWDYEDEGEPEGDDVEHPEPEGDDVSDDIRKEWQDARANRIMQFNVGDFKDSNIRMLTGTLKADWIQLPVQRYLAALPTLKQGCENLTTRHYKYLHKVRSALLASASNKTKNTRKPRQT